MSSYDEIRHQKHHDIEVKVAQVAEGRGSKRAFDLIVEDRKGNQFPFTVWEKSSDGSNTDWTEGHWYRLESVLGKANPGGKKLDGTTKLEVSHIKGPDSQRASLLIIPDSHLGKVSPGWDGGDWTIDTVEGFRRAIDNAIERDVDAAIHTGDLFHNDTSRGIPQSIGNAAQEQLGRLANAGIPFYYIFGNHEKDEGRIWMERFEDEGLASHLRSRPAILQDSVALYGLDHQNSWDANTLTFESSAPSLTSLMVMHQSVSPITGNPNPDCAVSEVVEAANIPFDMISVGHMHVVEETEYAGTVAFCSGATERINSLKQEPMVEHIEIGEGGIDRQKLALNI